MTPPVVPREPASSSRGSYTGGSGHLPQAIDSAVIMVALNLRLLEYKAGEGGDKAAAQEISLFASAGGHAAAAASVAPL